MDAKIMDLLSDVFAEAHLLCGSEGLFQSMFYHHARKYYSPKQIHREYSVNSGYIDFVLEDEQAVHAFEIKGGANGHRNSLSKMKEMERGGKGLAHDLKKPSGFSKLKHEQTVNTWIVCIDLKSLRIAFDRKDLAGYSAMAARQGSRVAYLSQEEQVFRVLDGIGEEQIKLNKVKNGYSGVGPKAILSKPTFWADYFEQTRATNGLECVHVGQFYHALREAGLGWNQCASEVFFNCNKHGTRNYYMPDFAVFGRESIGQFQLFGDHKRTVENDQFKLPYLVSVLEFKGGKNFQKQSISKKKKDISADLDKLAHKMRPRIQAGTSALEIVNRYDPMYTMVVTDSDPGLSEFIEDSRNKYRDILDIQCG